MAKKTSPRTKSTMMPKIFMSSTFKRSRFSKANLAIFAVFFAVIGGYIIFRSFAAGPNNTAANIFISASGSDTGSNCIRFSTPQSTPPSASTVCKTATKAYNLAQLGDTVWVLPGSYSGSSIAVGSGSVNKSLASNECNLTNQCVYFRSQPGQESAVTLTSNLSFSQNDTPDHVYYLNFQGAEACPVWNADGFGAATATNTGYGKDITVDNIKGTDCKPFMSGAWSYIRILNSDFSYNCDTEGDAGGFGIQSNQPGQGGEATDHTWAPSHIVIDKTSFHDFVVNGCTGGHQDCIHIYAWTESRISNSKFNRCYDSSILAEGLDEDGYAENVIIENNWFGPTVLGVNNCCFRGDSVPSAETFDSWTVRFNTSVDTFMNKSGNVLNNVSFIGNIGLGTITCKTGTNVVYAYNMMGSGACGATDTGNITNTQVKLKDTSSGALDLHLQASSSALNKVPTSLANGCAAVAKDIDGDVRPTTAGLFCDAGADQFSPPVANLWIDTTANPNNCVRQPTPGPYNDADACSPSAAVSAAQAGDLIFIKFGTYSSINLSKANVTIHPAPSEAVTFTGGVTVSAAGAIIDGGDIVGVDEPNRITAGDFSLSGDTATDKILEDVKGAPGTGLGVGGNHSVFRYSELGPNNPCTQSEDLIFAGRPGVSGQTDIIHNFQLIGNYLHDHGPNTSCPTVHSDLMDVQLGESLIAYNAFVGGCSTQCIFNSADSQNQANAQQDLDIVGNYFDESQTIAVQCDGECDLRYNTFGSGLGLAYRSGPSGYSGAVMTLTGNIWQNTVPCSSTNSPGAVVTHSYSIFPTSQTTACGTGSTKAEVTLTGTGAGAGRIASSSEPVVSGKGNPNSCPSIDIDGQTRPQPSATTCDAGADEIGGTATPPPPPPGPTPPPTPPPPTSQTPVAMYNFDEGSGTLANDGSTNNNDLAMPSTAWTASGKNSKAASFNGANSAQAVNSSSLAIGSTGTLEAWFKPNAIGRWHGLIAKGNDNAFISHNYSIEIDPSNKVECILGDGTDADVATSVGLINSTATFYHIACTWDGSNIKIYINGALDTTVAQTVTPAANSTPLFVGQYGGGNDIANGILDDVRIYNRSLSSSEVTTDMNTAVGSSAGPKVGDINGDGQINITDMSLLLSSYGQTTTLCTTNNSYTCDIATTGSSSGKVDIFDLSLLLSKYGT